MTNQLAGETSAYLLQHAENPVDWHAWGERAIRKARDEDKPIFLSIGYAACHWCHVMAHESFEDPRIARLMNENFINIKVDREERPDLDQIYMNAVQMMTGHGGWPMSVFLTPACEPFFGGTYWPPQSRQGMPGFEQVLRAVAEAWKTRRPRAVEQAARLTEQLRQTNRTDGFGPPANRPFRRELLSSAVGQAARLFDREFGGFGGAPKFPHPMLLQLLLRVGYAERRDDLLPLITQTLDRMAGGGIYDHLGGGFHRYSVDARWLVPHFEKMLYDNALLATCYTEAFQATGQTAYARVARETLDYVLREMTAPQGGFYSRQDADSEGQEGKYFVWTTTELQQLLGSEAAATFASVYGATATGNFEGANILHLPEPVTVWAARHGRDPDELERELSESRRKLLAARGRRIAPGRDEKILVSWNGLMIHAMALAGGVFQEPRYQQAARRAADFMLTHMLDDHRLRHSWCRAEARLAAYLDDYAALANSLVTLYEADFQPRWIDTAVQLAETLIERFMDREQGGFFYTATDHEPLIARNKDLFDSSVPSGNALAATLLVRLGRLTGRADFLDAAERAMQPLAGVLDRSPVAVAQTLLALDAWLGPMLQIVLVGPLQDADTAGVLAELRSRFLPHKVVALRDTGPEPRPAGTAVEPLLQGKAPLAPGPTLYVCENFTCQAPVHGLEAILAALDRLEPSRVFRGTGDSL